MISTISLDDAQPARFIDLPAIFGADLDKFPWLMRVIIENTLRHSEGNDTVAYQPFVDWLNGGRSDSEIAFHPGRLLMHDTTCVPALVDMAALRAALSEAGGDPSLLNPMLPVDVSVDHSIAVDTYGTPDALALNIKREVDRNAERYRLMKWSMEAFRGIKVHAPGTGIMHTMNLEQLASVITTTVFRNERWLVPDTLIGTDSHTPMINGIGVLAWGVGGLEAEGVMFGMPVMLRIPEVIGIRLSGELREGVLSTDLALLVTERLRAYGMSGEFVEFFGPGVSSLTAGDRAVVANMTPEYGGASGYFPIDNQTIRYMADTGRSERDQELVRSIAKRQGLWFDPDVTPRYTDVLEIDLSQVFTSLAGPRRPQDRISPAEAPQTLEKLYNRPLDKAVGHGEPPDGAVAIAAITSCTNTSDPRLTIAAGLLARNARRLGLTTPSWVKTSLAPGSPAAKRYIMRAGLMEDLSALGFDIVGFGCTTCIGNSGPLVPSMSEAIESGALAVALLSGNRNFPGRVHPLLDAAFLASPPMVVAYALAGDINRDVQTDPIGHGVDGKKVFLADIWPGAREIDEVLRRANEPDDYASAFAEAETNPAWTNLKAPSSTLFPWDQFSTYIRRPPFVSLDEPVKLGAYRAKPLLVLGNDITTDHISPAGQIPAQGEAGKYLIDRGDDPSDLNVFASRRGNWEAMVRGLFTNRTVVNLLDKDLVGGFTIYGETHEVLPLWQAAERYKNAEVPVVIVAGERYGAGSSRDWAAKGVALLGVRAVIASSFERIHRSNLIGMGIIPLHLPEGVTSAGLSLTVDDWIEVNARPALLTPRGLISVQVNRASGEVIELECRAAVETEQEVALLNGGGIMPFILKRSLRMPGDHIKAAATGR